MKLLCASPNRLSACGRALRPSLWRTLLPAAVFRQVGVYTGQILKGAKGLCRLSRTVATRSNKPIVRSGSIGSGTKLKTSSVVSRIGDASPPATTNSLEISLPPQPSSAHSIGSSCESRPYIISVMRSDRPKYASNNFAEGTAEENKATAQGTITYFGTYSVSEADRTIAIHIEGSSFPNWDGADQKRLFVFSGNELKLISPAASGAGTAEVIWKRAK